MALRQFGATREARRAVRRLVDLECGVFSDVWGEAILHRVTDVSEDGLWIETDLLLEVGSEVTLSFYPPDWEEPLYVAGQVHRVELERGPEQTSSIGMGIAFETLRTDERRQLTQSMRCLRPDDSYILDQRTLVGVPVGPDERLESFEPVPDPSRTVVGWSAPAQPLSSKPARKPSEGESPKPDPDSPAFQGGLDLATSVFSGSCSD
ncbi:MAG: PilZ domain-containing protein [Myxococcales bacterium]|nr:PilZ domain-containing protein [Myxococcales bacterium]MDH3484061.1 PilZ domain-containing protein [Myxococcales bacterium]